MDSASSELVAAHVIPATRPTNRSVSTTANGADAASASEAAVGVYGASTALHGDPSQEVAQSARRVYISREGQQGICGELVEIRGRITQCRFEGLGSQMFSIVKALVDCEACLLDDARPDESSCR